MQFTNEEIHYLTEILPIDLGVPGAKVDLSRVTALPFYEGGLLVEVDRKGEFMLVGPGAVQEREVIAITGGSMAIHNTNGDYGVSITKETVTDYLRFFCAKITSSNGEPFTIVEPQKFARVGGGIVEVYAPKIIEETQDGNFILMAWSWHEGHIFECMFEVSLDGLVLMIEDSGAIDVELLN